MDPDEVLECRECRMTVARSDDTCSWCGSTLRAQTQASIQDASKADMPGGVAHTRSTDPETSRMAALSVGDLRPNQYAVWLCLLDFGPMCDERLVERYDSIRALRQWPKQSVSGLRTRRKELVDGGLVKEWGEEFTASGRRTKRWGVR